MSEFLVIAIAALYLVGLFLIAFNSEKYFARFSNNGFIYALSLMVYCTAWTFYGSVGRASTDGVEFLAIYIGPLLTVPFWWFLLRKMVRITNTLRISSIADFISIRYGKNARLGTVVALACFLGVIPYISLQLKAISNSISIISETNVFEPSFLIVALLTIFAILFGARNVDANQRKPGLISAIAFESLVKLLAFLILGFYVVYGMFNGLGDVFNQASAITDLSRLTTLEGEGDLADWFLISLVSAIAFFLLPRQFQVGSIEAGKERHILTAMRTVPVYLLLINLFVVPIALAGMILLPDSNSDFYVLSLPLSQGNKFLAVLVFLGGFSAATSMILVSTTALSTMMSNYVFIPLVLRKSGSSDTEETGYQSMLLLWRRISIVIIMLLSLAYFKSVIMEQALVQIGITSFIAIAQLAPAFFGGLYWKRANTKAATVGIVSGLVVWFFFLVWPGMEQLFLGFLGLPDTAGGSHLISFVTSRMGVSTTAATIVLSLLVNLGFYILYSYSNKQSAKEINQAELFVDIFRYSASYDSSVAWRGTAYYPQVRKLLVQFIGEKRSDAVLNRYAENNSLDWSRDQRVDSKLISYLERILTGIIGPSSARIMVSKVVQEEEIRLSDVMDILHESQETIRLNRELQQKSQQLARASENLKIANDKLKEVSDLKNEFLYTVTHELRTPITAIRAISEILEDNPDMENEERANFITQIIYEAERMSKLISNVLDLEKFESGNQELERGSLNLKALIHEEVQALRAMILDRNIDLKLEISNDLDPVYADEERIRQVLTNLLSNAVKYCDQEEGLIRITAYRNDDHIKVNVSNNGAGIAAGDMENIFDKFYQVRNQTSKKPAGHGLGLAICKNIVEMHKGRIGVSESEGLTRFSFSLPVFRKNKSA